MRRRLHLAIALAAILSAREAYGDDIYHIKSPSTLETQKGSKLSLPPGYFLSEDAWRERDEALKQAENDRTRLKAENDSLRQSASSPAWRTALVAAVVGLVAGGAVAAYVK